MEEIREYAVNWEGWRAYATFYLWRTLLVTPASSANLPSLGIDLTPTSSPK